MFRDRVDAGRQLADRLASYRGEDAIVLALPRGGVVIGAEVARALGAPLDVIISRKIGAPDNPEYAIGAVSESGDAMIDEEAVQVYGIPRGYIDAEIARQMGEISRRVAYYRGGKPLTDLTRKAAILVDDGVATGYTMFAAVKAVRSLKPLKLVVAVPVSSPTAAAELRKQADEVVVLMAPEFFMAVGAFYANFEQVSDAEVKRYLESVQ